MIRVGVGAAKLEFADGYGLYGYGPPGGRGYNAARGSAEFDQLSVKALYIEGPVGKLLIITYDAAAGSRRLHAGIVRDLNAIAEQTFHDGEVWIVGTHTHAAPGHYLGNLYDQFGQWPPGFREPVFTELRRKGLNAAMQALSGPKQAKVGIVEEPVWLGANRSLRPFLDNFSGVLSTWERETAIGKAPAHLAPEERAIDPRLRVIAFVGDNGESLASWASHSCHPATWPPAKWRPYHRDWPGVARDLVEQDVPFAMLNMGANGDVTALPVGQVRIERPLERVRAIGEGIGQAWRTAHQRAREAARDVDFELGFLRFVPNEWQLPRWDIGLQVVCGAPEIDPGPVRRALRGYLKSQRRRGTQGPKLSVLGPLTPIVSRLLGLNPSPEHPIGLLRLGTHLVFASPFEQTTYAAYGIEQRLIARWQAVRGETVTAGPLGLVGDYAGYMTTAAEYAHQYYEAAHTLYGVNQRDTLARVWASMITGESLGLSQRPPIDQRQLESFLPGFKGI